MNFRTSRRHWFTGWLGLALGLAVSLVSSPAAGTDRYWGGPFWGGSGWWSDGVNWGSTFFFTPPLDNDNVFLTQSDNSNRTVWYGSTLYPGFTGTLTQLTIDATGSGAMTLNQGYGGYALPLAPQIQYVGYNGTGTHLQSLGANTVSSTLYLGYNAGSRGIYELSGGSLSAYRQYIGYYGTGAFTQSGGTNSRTMGNIYLGYYSGGTGTYNLSGTGSLYAQLQVIGSSGAGLFQQSGGTNTVNTTLTLGSGSGGSGTYELSGGNLWAATQYTGYYGAGAFTQSGGVNNANVLQLGVNSGSTGTFKQTGGDNHVGGLYLGYKAGSSGTYELSGGSLSANNAQYIGYSGAGAFTQSGGTNNASQFSLGYAPGGSGTYELSGAGSLSASSQIIGNVGTGLFKQSGGTNTITYDLHLGSSTSAAGTYELSGGSLSAYRQYIGYYGPGAFTQGGGTNTVNNTLYLAYIAGRSATYNLQGGALTAGTIQVNSGGTFNLMGGSLNPTTFIQSGGTVTGSLENRRTFTYSGGAFSGRLLNYGTVNFNSNFTAGNGLANYAPITISLGRTLTLNGAGLDNRSTLNLAGGALGGSGPLANNATLSGHGTINASGGLSNAGTMNLTGGSAAVQGDVTNQALGQLNIASSPTTFTGNVTNAGTVRTTNANVTWAGTFTNSGAYISDPAVNSFWDLDVRPTGYLVGGAGDLFQVSRSFYNQSAQNTLWNTDLASLTFTGETGPWHEMYLPGADLGVTPAGYSHNFAWSRLDITGQFLTLGDGNDTEGGALYVGEILGVDIINGYVNNLVGCNLNVYYDPSLAGNAYLGGRSYDLIDGGYLIPTPAPTTWLLLSTGLAGLGLLGRRRKEKHN